MTVTIHVLLQVEAGEVLEIAQGEVDGEDPAAVPELLRRTADEYAAEIAKAAAEERAG